MPIKKEEFNGLVNKNEQVQEEYMRDSSPAGNNFNQTSVSPQINLGATASPHLNQREAMNKTVNVQKDKHLPFSMADQHTKGVPIARPRGPNIHSDSATGSYHP